MKWQTKADVSRWIARLPEGCGNALYGLAQRMAESNRSADRHFHAAGETLEHLRKEGIRLEGTRCLEIGTGKRMIVPVALWLCGAERVITVDAHRIREEALIRSDLKRIPGMAEEIAKNPLVRHDRLEALCTLLGSAWRLPDVMDRCGVDYLAPADARKLDLEHASVDLQVSFTVFEHIAPDILLDILRETARVLRPEGLALNLVDYSDHFSHRDASLHRLNFLRYSDTEWTRIAGNRFHYLNRLRHDDMLSLHAKAGLSLVSEHPLRIPALLDSAPPLDPSYRNKPAEILSTLGAWIAARPNSATPAKPFTTF